MLAKRYRLGKHDSIYQILRRGKLTRRNGLMCRTLANRLPYSRFSVSISQKASKRSTERNQVRRQIFGVLQQTSSHKTPGIDCSFSVSKEAMKLSRVARRELLISVLRNAKLIP